MQSACSKMHRSDFCRILMVLALDSHLRHVLPIKCSLCCLSIHNAICFVMIYLRNPHHMSSKHTYHMKPRPVIFLFDITCASNSWLEIHNYKCLQKLFHPSWNWPKYSVMSNFHKNWNALLLCKYMYMYGIDGCSLRY